jgi:hypothetical protein
VLGALYLAPERIYSIFSVSLEPAGKKYFSSIFVDFLNNPGLSKRGTVSRKAARIFGNEGHFI